MLWPTQHKSAYRKDVNCDSSFIIVYFVNNFMDVHFRLKQYGCWCTGEAEGNRDLTPECVVNPVWNGWFHLHKSDGAS